MGFSVLGKVATNLGIQLIAIGRQALLGRAHASVQIHHSLQGRVGLQTDDHLVLLVNVAGLKIADAGNPVGFHIQHAAVFHLLHQKVAAFPPHAAGFFGGPLQKAVVPFVQGVVLLDKIAHVYFFLPNAAVKSFPRFFCSHIFHPPISH